MNWLAPLGLLGSLALFQGLLRRHKILILGYNFVKGKVVVRAELGQYAEVDSIDLTSEDGIHGSIYPYKPGALSTLGHFLWRTCVLKNQKRSFENQVLKASAEVLELLVPAERAPPREGVVLPQLLGHLECLSLYDLQGHLHPHVGWDH